MLEKTNTNQPAKWFTRNEDKFNFDLPVQRGDVWNLEDRSDFIHTLISGYAVPPIYSVEKDGKLYNFVDGKQRLKTIIMYMRDEFALHSKTDIVEGDDVEIARLKFSELSKEFRERIEDYYFTIFIFKNLNEDQIDKLFAKLNKGKKLNAQEFTRALIGSEIRDYLIEVASLPFWKEKINLSKTDYNRFIDQELILQVMSLVMEEEIGFSTIELRNFAVKLKNEGILENIKETISNLSDYLNKAFVEPDKMLRKVHLPNISKVALLAMEENTQPEVYGNIVLTFLRNQNELKKAHKKDSSLYIGKYNEALEGGSAKKDNVDVRVDELQCFYEEFMEGINSEVNLKKVSGL